MRLPPTILALPWYSGYYSSLWHWQPGLESRWRHLLLPTRGWMAEWSKALVLGTSPKGRGFESHHCQNFVPNKILFGDSGDRTRDISHAKRALYHWATSPPIGCHRYVTNWSPVGCARLAEWSKAWDLSSHNRKIAWVRTPHLADIFPSVLDVHNTVLLAILIGSSGAIG